jgi:phosphatidylglycerol---prolipoprotein diacylglyceryl transferase
MGRKATNRTHQLKKIVFYLNFLINSLQGNTLRAIYLYLCVLIFTTLIKNNMYPNLRFAFYDIFGLDLPFLGLVQSYGFFLALSFLAAAWWLGVEFRRREREGLMAGTEESYTVGKPLSIFDVVWNAVLGFVVGFKGVYAVTNSTVFAGAEAKANLFSWQHGNWIAGILLSIGFVGWKYWEKLQEKKEYPTEQQLTKVVYPHQRIGDIVIISAISGVFGAKLFYLLEEQPTDWVDALFSGSGLTVYGGLIIAFCVVSYYLKIKKMSYLNVLDTTAPALILAYGVGRLGCHFSGDGDWGDPNVAVKPFSWLPDWVWAYSYPNNVISEGVAMADCSYYPFAAEYNYCMQLASPAYPTPVWEFVMGFIIFLGLAGIRRWAKQGGLLFSIYLIFNGVERFGIETIRVNGEYNILGFALTQAQVIAVMLFIIGIILTVYFYYKQTRPDFKQTFASNPTANSVIDNANHLDNKQP